MAGWTGSRSALVRPRRMFSIVAAVAIAAVLPLGIDAAGAATFSNATAITGIVESGTARAQPYPSTIAVSGMTGTVTDVDVSLCGFSATFPADVDALLVGPGGTTFSMFMSDVGGDNNEPPAHSISNFSLTFSDQAANDAPLDAKFTNNATYRPTDDDGDEFELVVGDNFPDPAPAATHTPADTPAGPLSTFNGINPNGNWNLYIVDDFTAQPEQGETVLPNFSCGWSLSVTTGGGGGTTTTAGPTTTTAPTTTTTAPTTTTTTAPTTTTGPTTTTTTGSGSQVCSSGGVQVIPLPPPGPNPPPWLATPYPSSITTAGLGGTITDVDILLNGFQSAAPSDLDFLLVSPSGRNLLFMSDSGGDNDNFRPVSGVNLRFSDQAEIRLPGDSTLTSGTFKPRDDDDDTSEAAMLAPDSFPAPAPAPSNAGRLATFNDTAPNGTWSLYLVDDFPGPEVGSVSGWCVVVTTTAGGGGTTTTAAPTTTIAPTTTTAAPTTTSTAPTTTTTTPGGTTCFGATPTIVGGPGTDSLTGTSGPDVIVGLGGVDLINGMGGDDRICAGEGDDTVNGGTGNDRVSGGGGLDLVSGGAGDDELLGDSGDDTLEGNSGNDSLDGGADVDVCRGGADVDTFTACETERT